jgi:hypothetical protein
MISLRCALAVALAVALAAVATAEPALSDPYEVLARHYEALGGLEALKAQETVHSVGTMELAGLTGTLEVWEAHPDRSRVQIDLNVFKQTIGDNGDVAWEVDANGKLRIEKEENALARRRTAALLAGYEHLDPDSEDFDITLEGVEAVAEDECYAVKIASPSDGTVRIWYVDTDDFLLRKTVTVYPDHEEHQLLSDYRDVGGVLRAYGLEVVYLPTGQEYAVTATEIEANVEIDPALFDPPADDARDFAFTTGGDFAEVPFQFIENHLFLPVRIGDVESLWILDTGASASVIDLGLAERLGLETAGEMKGQGAGNAVDVTFATLPPFSVEGIAFDEQKVAAIDLVGLFRKTTELEVDGVLGYDFLSRFVTRVDYANELLTFYDPDTFEYSGGGVILDAPLRGNMFTPEVTVDGVHGGRWSLDLGAGRTTFHAPYAMEHDLLTLDGVRGVGFGAGGRIMHRLARFETIEFGGHTIAEPVISMAGSEGEVVGTFGGRELTGNLGNSLFKHFVLYLDYEHQAVIVEKGEDFGKYFPFDRSGLQLWRPDDGPYEVLFVDEETPADEAGLREGDRVLTIDGAEADSLGGLVEIRTLLRGEVGREFVIGAERDGVPFTARLTLRELL